MDTNQIIASADKLYQLGQCDAAVDLLLDGIKKLPHERRIFHCLAELMIDSEQFKDAESILNQLPDGEKDPTKAELIGHCKTGLEETQQILECADQIFKINPDSAAGFYFKGMAALLREQSRAAEKHFKAAISANSGCAEAYCRLAELKQEVHPAEAFNLLEKGFKHSPIRRSVVLSYHSAAIDPKNLARAEKQFRAAVKSFPYSQRLSYLLIDLLLRQEKQTAAMSEIERALITFGIDDGIVAAALHVRRTLGSLEIDPTDRNRPMVSLCMITKDEQQLLARCLASAKPIVDEIIVVDTGSQDKTKDIATIFGAKVYDYVWHDDFAAARNFSLTKADGDWIFILDADEVIAENDYEAFNHIIQNGSLPSCAYSFTTRNYTTQANTLGWMANDGAYPGEELGLGWIPSEKVRLFKNRKEIRFTYPIHEIVEPLLQKLNIPVQKCSIPIHHFGKLNEDKGNHKTATYYKIGKSKLDQLGHNSAALRELAIQAGHLGKHDEVIELWQRYIKHAPEDAEAFVNMGTAYFNLGRYKQAAITAQKAMALAPGLKEAHFNYAISELHLGNAPRAISVFQRILNQHSQYLSAEFMLAAAYCCAGNKNKARAGFERICQTAVGPALAVTFYDLARRLKNAHQIDYALSLLETAADCNIKSTDIEKLLNECLRK